MTKPPETASETDAVELLIHQHEQIRGLLQEVDEKKGEQRAEAFERLRRLFAVHETAEEEVVHPMARRSVKNGHKVVNARLEEENECKRMLRSLGVMGPSAPGFDVLFAEFRKAVLAHNEHEEREEFPELRTHRGGERRVMSTAIKAAEATAPTHPHPGMETATKNMLLGPFASVADRTRDVVRKAMSR
jgi:hemerythrin superfamily protein